LKLATCMPTVLAHHGQSNTNQIVETIGVKVTRLAKQRCCCEGRFCNHLRSCASKELLNACFRNSLTSASLTDYETFKRRGRRGVLSTRSTCQLSPKLVRIKTLAVLPPNKRQTDAFRKIDCLLKWQEAI